MMIKGIDSSIHVSLFLVYLFYLDIKYPIAILNQILDQMVAKHISTLPNIEIPFRISKIILQLEIQVLHASHYAQIRFDLDF